MARGRGRACVGDRAGTVRFFSYPAPADPCILVRRTNGEFTAFSQKCTHLSCAVYYAPERDRLECPCHEGYFSAANGRVIQGRRHGRSRRSGSTAWRRARRRRPDAAR